MYHCVESHMHMGLRTGPLKEETDKIAFVRKELKLLKEIGVKYIRDGGDSRGVSVFARRLSPEYGIVYRTPVYALYRKGFYGDIIGCAFDEEPPGAGQVESAGFRLFRDSFRYTFERWVSLKPDHMKIPLTGLMDFNCYGKIGETAFNREELSYMIKTAHDRGLSVMVHANGEDAVKMAADLGADSIEHGYFAGRGGLEAMARSGTIWVPTLAPLGNLSEMRPENLKSSLPVIDRIYNDQLEALRSALELGVFTAVGSDAGAYCVERGKGYFDELRHFQRAGVSLQEANRLAFENGMKLIEKRI